MTIIEAQHISKTYTIGNRRITVLDEINLRVENGEFVVIKGDSGSGKTTLLSLLSGLDKPTRGNVVLNGRDITHVDENEMAPIRNKTIGFIFQSFHLIPSQTALENIMFPAEIKNDKQARDKALRLLTRVGLEKRADNLPGQLSGGEKQRVAICRALINNPALIFADEPTGNLDSTNGQVILDLMRRFQREGNSTLILVTHSLDVADSADRVLHLCDGKLVSGDDAVE